MELIAWNRRDSNLEDNRRYQNLLVIHQITQVWLNEIAPIEKESKNSTHRLERFIPPHLVQNLWLLEKLKLDQLSSNLSNMIDSTSVNHFLDELDEIIWIVQLSVLNNAIGGSSDPESLINSLEQITWQEGKKHAEMRWGNQKLKHPLTLQQIYQTLQNSALQQPKAFLKEHETPKKLSFYWLTSPLSKNALTINPRADILCKLYHQFILGFFYGIEKALKIEVENSQLFNKEVWKFTLLLTY